ncbi:MAG: 5'/3'-nucleotidase SurE [Bacteroidales bacterium]|nr:5'/3'-nucleotidase SurE [Bacteroidales bacterium]
MSLNQKLILITNDDGVEAKGLHHLVECVKHLGKVIVVAPAAPNSGQSSAITVDRPLKIKRHSDYHGAEVYSVNGTPVDCVKLAMHAILPHRPDMLLSGINHGSNAGTSVIYSGTMGAVVEGCCLSIPSVGFSLLHHSLAADFSPSTPWVVDISQRVLEQGLPPQVCLNVNIPALCLPKGSKVVKAARGYWTDEYKDYTDPQGNPFYMLTGRFVNTDLDDPSTDEYWLEREYVTIVPVTPDMNATGAIDDVKHILYS